jgi:hypothetical protein
LASNGIAEALPNLSNFIKLFEVLNRYRFQQPPTVLFYNFLPNLIAIITLSPSTSHNKFPFYDNINSMHAPHKQPPHSPPTITKTFSLPFNIPAIKVFHTNHGFIFLQSSAK